jgi:hypothetical protein
MPLEQAANLVRHISTALALVCIPVCLAASPFALSQQKPVRPSVYAFGGSGQFIKIAIGSSVAVTLGSLTSIDGNQIAFPPAVPGPGTKTERNWLGSEFTYDRQLQRIYAVFPPADEKSPRPVSLISMRVPDMKVVARIPLPFGPALLLSPGGDKLFASGMQELPEPGEGSLQISTTIYNASDLTPVKKFAQVVDRQKYLMADVVNHASFQPGAYFSPDGSLIFDRMSVIRVGADSFDRRDVDIFALLTPSEREELRSYGSVDAASGKSYLPFAFESSASGVLLLRVVNARQANEALISIDMKAEKVFRILHIPLGRASLTPDSKMILVEMLRPAASAPNQAASRSLIKTGNIVAYDARSGDPLKSFEAKDLAGNEENHRIVCFDPGSKSFIYEAASKLYLIRTSFEERPVLIDSGFIAGPETACLYTDM